MLRRMPERMVGNTHVLVLQLKYEWSKVEGCRHFTQQQEETN